MAKKAIFIFIILFFVIKYDYDAYSIYNYKQNIVNVAAKLAAMLSCAILAIVTANLSSAIGGYSIFIITGLLFLLCGECISLIDLSDKPLYFYIKNITIGLGYLCFFMAGVLYSSFNVFGMLVGLFLAGGFVALLLALKANKTLHYFISHSILLLFLCMFFGQGLVMTISAPKLMPALFYIIGSLFVLVGTLIYRLRKPEKNIVRITANAIYIIGIIATASSIFFM